MKIIWQKVNEVNEKKFNAMGEADRFAYFLMKLYGSPYGWGNETPEKSDCSGAVCMALFAATGLLIRTTADDLKKRVFTVVNPSQNQIKAVFFISKKEIKHVDRIVPAGTATHIAGMVGNNVVLNSQEPYALVRSVADVSRWYLQNGYEVVTRGLDRGALEKLAKEGKTVYDLDADFRRYFDLSA